MSSTETGRQAETAAAAYLQRHGFTIIERNWRTRWCEIDIVAQKAKTIHFVEVKYRKTDAWGGGLEYITPRKLQQMQFAAQLWVANHAWKDEYSLGAIEVTGTQFAVSEWLPDLR
ncbi:MAG TPA: YraN family protein [Candidatus Saccharimonadales bacterium]|nr:YraN family protein [Candidatus Saccharimonadales bacterium]